MPKLVSRLFRNKGSLGNKLDTIPKLYPSSDIFYPEGSHYHIPNPYKPKPGEKRVYKINVRDLSPEEVEKYVNDIVERFKQNATFNNSSESGVL
jgi:hypothetical protein